MLDNSRYYKAKFSSEQRGSTNSKDVFIIINTKWYQYLTLLLSLRYSSYFAETLVEQ